MNDLILTIRLPRNINSRTRRRSHRLAMILLVRPLTSIRNGASRFSSQCFCLLHSRLNERVLAYLQLRIIPSYREQGTDRTQRLRSNMNDTSNITSCRSSLTLSNSSMRDVLNYSRLIREDTRLFCNEGLLINRLIRLMGLSINANFLLHLITNCDLRIIKGRPRNGLRREHDNNISEMTCLTQDVHPISTNDYDRVLFLLALTRNFDTYLLRKGADREGNRACCSFLVVRFCSFLSF